MFFKRSSMRSDGITIQNVQVIEPGRRVEPNPKKQELKYQALSKSEAKLRRMGLR